MASVALDVVNIPKFQHTCCPVVVLALCLLCQTLGIFGVYQHYFVDIQDLKMYENLEYGSGVVLMVWQTLLVYVLVILNVGALLVIKMKTLHNQRLLIQRRSLAP